MLFKTKWNVNSPSINVPSLLPDHPPKLFKGDFSVSISVSCCYHFVNLGLSQPNWEVVHHEPDLVRSNDAFIIRVESETRKRGHLVYSLCQVGSKF